MFLEKPIAPFQSWSWILTLSFPLPVTKGQNTDSTHFGDRDIRKYLKCHGILRFKFTTLVTVKHFSKVGGPFKQNLPKKKRTPATGCPETVLDSTGRYPVSASPVTHIQSTNSSVKNLLCAALGLPYCSEKGARIFLPWLSDHGRYM